MYGFGSASLRFQNEVYGCHLPFGKVNKAVIELDKMPEAVDVTETHVTAPSRLLPEFASNFKTEPGRTFARTVPREAPPSESGEPRYWVQPKDTGGLFPGDTAPPPFVMGAPRGAGHPAEMHEPPKMLLTPAERREALVFDKCHQRANATLRKASHDACLLTHTMQHRFPNGVIGLEGPGCPDSIIYAESRQKREAMAAKASKLRVERHDNIASKRETQLDYRLGTHDPHNTTQDKMFPSKAASSLGIRGAPTVVDPAASYELRPMGTSVGDRGFRSNQEKPLLPPRETRAMRLHTLSTGGKPYDIISGAALTIRPDPVEPSAYSHDRRAHPSNLSMPHRGGTAPTLIGPVPEAHKMTWQPPSPTKSPSRSFLR